jgi:hypothetical protein
VNGRLVIELGDHLEWPVQLEVKIKRDLVEMWVGTRSVAVVDRDALATWLADPVGTFERHDVALWVSPLGLVIEVWDRVRPTLVDPRVLGDLRDRLARPRHVDE